MFYEVWLCLMVYLEVNLETLNTRTYSRIQLDKLRFLGSVQGGDKRRNRLENETIGESLFTSYLSKQIKEGEGPFVKTRR